MKFELYYVYAINQTECWEPCLSAKSSNVIVDVDNVDQLIKIIQSKYYSHIRSRLGKHPISDEELAKTKSFWYALEITDNAQQLYVRDENAFTRNYRDIGVYAKLNNSSDLKHIKTVRITRSKIEQIAQRAA